MAQSAKSLSSLEQLLGEKQALPQYEPVGRQTSTEKTCEFQQSSTTGRKEKE